jgi:CAAX protease family protein
VHRGALLREVGLAFLATLALTSVLYRLRFLPFVERNIHAIVGLAFLLIPIRILQRKDASFERFGIALGGLLGEEATGGLAAFPRDLASALSRGKGTLLRDLGIALGLIALIFVPFYFGFRLWYFWILGFPEPHFAFRPTLSFASQALAQVLVVALPEEFFYRGYVQTRLGQVFPQRFRVLGGDYGVHVVLTSVLFALGHFLVDFAPARLAVFFPALLFGWLREKRGEIGAGVFLHALCNVAADVLTIGFRL